MQRTQSGARDGGVDIHQLPIPDAAREELLILAARYFGSDIALIVDLRSDLLGSRPGALPRDELRRELAASLDPSDDYDALLLEQLAEPASPPWLHFVFIIDDGKPALYRLVPTPAALRAIVDASTGVYAGHA